jgi:hypothetical protein
MRERSIGVVIIRAPNNRLETHLTMISEIIQILAVIRPGQIIEVFHPEMKT